MPRVKKGFKARRRRNRILDHAEGFNGPSSRQFACAIERVHGSWQDAYRDRRKKKRDFRRLWIIRIGAAAKECGSNYNRLISGLKKAGIDLDRKVLAEIAVRDPSGFKAVVEAAKA
jgi:large subunit ribosomal protein L20